ncbi:MAG: UDP-N-acetyl-D-mannosamine dehydrogenase [Propioniciclava sp.]
MPTLVESGPHIVVVGLGYIGLPTAAILATHGARVTGVDTNPATVAAVNQGRVPFVERDLEASVAGAVSQGRLVAMGTPPEADVYIIAVPTPLTDGHRADLSYVNAAADSIATCLRGDELVILESTSPPGTTQHLADRILQARPDLSADGFDGRPIVDFAHCPERVLPGRVMGELVTNDRVIGGLSERAGIRAQCVYRIYCQGELPLTDATTAEMVKLAENSFRDVNIAFANELATISGHVGVDVWELIGLANRHPRVEILEPGPGVGGHCIAVDPWFLVEAAPAQAQLIRTARDVNDGRPGKVVDRVLEEAALFNSPRIAALGLAFKSDIDDLRESPARRIVGEVCRRLPRGQILVVEPHISELPPELEAMPNAELCELNSAVATADIVLLLVSHQAFRQVGLLVADGEHPIVIDTRGVWRHQYSSASGTGAESISSRG